MLRVLLTVTFVALAWANDSSCGAKEPSVVANCDKIDRGSCGNSCCMVDVHIPGTAVNTSYLHELVTGYLSGGKDGSYTHETAPDAAGHNPGEDLTPYPIKWDYIFQGTHTTTGGYVDTLNFNIARASSTGTSMRIFSISNIHGALGDNGQTYKNIAFLLSGIQPRESGWSITIAHGCGS